MNNLIPDEILQSVLQIDFANLKAKGIKGLLIDIDNTIVPWGQKEIAKEIVAWIQEAKEQGFKLALVSNALPERALYFAHFLDIPGVGQALKPLKRGFLRAKQQVGLTSQEMAIIGDQLFTDIYGGNRLGFYTILVNPLSRQELGATKVMRKLEQRTFYRMKRKGLVQEQSLQIRQGND